MLNASSRLQKAGEAGFRSNREGRRIAAQSNTAGSNLAQYVPELTKILSVDGTLNLSYCSANHDDDPVGMAFRRAVADYEGVPVSSVRATGSLLEFFRWIPSLLGAKTRVRLSTDFPGFMRWSMPTTDLVVAVDLHSDRIDPSALADAVRQACSPLILLGFPVTNPGQQIMSLEVAEAALGANNDAILIIDNAYRGVREIPDLAQFALTNDRTMYVNTAAKDLCLPGCRVGWAIAKDPLLARLADLPPYEVSPLSLEQVRSILSHPSVIAKIRGIQMQARDELTAELRRLGLLTRCGLGNWVMIYVGHSAADIVRKLGVNFQIDVQFLSGEFLGWIRVSATVPGDARLIADALAELLSSGI